MMNYTVVLAGLVVSQPARLSAQVYDTLPGRLGVAIGRTFRERADYGDRSNRWGFGGDLSFEQQYGKRWSIVVNASGAHFTATDNIVNVAGAGGASTTLSAVKSSFTSSAWAPAGQADNGLQAFGAALGFRVYPLSDDNTGPFMGGGFGIAHLGSSNQGAYRPAIAVSAGHVWHTTGGLRYFAEARYTWNGFDMDYGFRAKSPRWLIAPVIGFSAAL